MQWLLLFICLWNFTLPLSVFLYYQKHPKGAKSSAITFSLIESAKENGLNPYEYLKYLLEELPSTSTKDLDKFLPWSKEIPEHVKTPKKK
jgi:uncharacterized membrane protein